MSFLPKRRADSQRVNVRAQSQGLSSLAAKPSLSYSNTSRRRSRPLTQTPYDGFCHSIWSIVMNTIIYIVGLIVVVGLVLSFFGLR